MFRVSRILALLLAAGTAAAVASQPRPDPTLYEVDPEHSSVMFKVRHLGVSTVTGRFNRFAATFWYDPADPGASRVTATIDVASVDTDNERRDNHLRSQDFFWADSFPTMTFESRGVRKTGDDELEVEGDLTIRGVTLPVVLEVEIEGTGTAGQGRPLMGLTAETEINRHDYGLRWNRAVENGWLVGDDVRILLEVEARGAAPGN